MDEAHKSKFFIHLRAAKMTFSPYDTIRVLFSISSGVLSRVGHDYDFEDEVYFKRERVVTPRFLNFVFNVLYLL